MNTIERALQREREKGGRQPQGENANASKVGAQFLHIDFEYLEAAGLLRPDKGRTQLAEEMRSIKRPVLNKAFGSSPSARANIVMVTSALPGEGKSFTSVNLAISIAMELNRTVMLVDADVEKSSVSQYLHIQQEKGLVDYLLNDSMALSEVLLKTNIPELTILPSGLRHEHSTEIFSSDNMIRLVDELSTRYPDRVVIFDSPPVLLTSEARVLASLMGQILLVVESVKTTHAQVKEAVKILSKCTDNVALVLNKSRVTGVHGYHYGSYYGATGTK